MASDDPLEQALELLQQPLDYYRTYSSSKTEREMVAEPIVTALRLIIGELQSLRAEVDELRGEEGTIQGGGIHVFDENDRPWERG